MEDYERTLAVIEPDAVEYQGAIVRIIEDAGFTIIRSRTVQLSPEQASEFLRYKKDDPNYHTMCAILSEGPILAMCASKVNAVADMLWLIGPYEDAKRNAPGSLRALFGANRDELRQVVHGSANIEQARFEIRFFFPSLILEPIFCEQSLDNYLSAMVNPVLMEGLHLLASERPLEPLVWLADWLRLNNPYKAKVDDDAESSSELDYQVTREIEIEEGASLGGHMGAQSKCECSDFIKNGLCLCSLSEIARLE